MTLVEEWSFTPNHPQKKVKRKTEDRLIHMIWMENSDERSNYLVDDFCLHKHPHKYISFWSRVFSYIKYGGLVNTFSSSAVKTVI